MKKVLLVDAHSLIHRAFYAIPLLTTTRGEPTNAAFGFTRMLLRVIADEKPSHVGVAFDRPGPTFRHTAYADYKANREKPPDALRTQFALVREIVEALSIPIYDAEGFEADDVLGTLARQATDMGYRVLIVTGDRDALQLVGPGVEALLTRRQGIQELERFDTNRVTEQYGITPAQMADYKGLVGDSSDHIPGVPGIGPKTAQRLLATYGTLEGVIEHAQVVRGRVGDALRAHLDTARLSKRLAVIRTNAPVTFDEPRTRLREPDLPRLVPLLVRLEFRTILDDLLERFPDAGKYAHNPGVQVDHETQAWHAPGPDWAVAIPAEKWDRARLGVTPSMDAPYDEACANEPLNPDSWTVCRNTAEVVAWAERVKRIGACVLLVVASGDEPLRSEPDAMTLLVREDGKRLGCVIPLAHTDGRAIVAPLVSVLADPNILKVTWDVKRVRLLLSHLDLIVDGVCDDVMLGAYLLNPGQGRNTLSDISMRLLQTHLEPVPEGGPELGDAWVSALGRQTSAIMNIAGALQPLVRSAGMERLYRELEMPLALVLAQMEQTGIALDTDVLAEMSVELRQEAAHLEAQIFELAGEAFNINSPKQLAEVLFERLGLPVLARNKSGPSTSADVLERLAEEHDIVAKILEYRQVTKLRGTYVDALPRLIHPETGRLHTTFQQAVTATGRLSSVNPNLQNIPIRSEAGRRIRAAFVSGEKGWYLMAADYSQIELRVLAHISRDPNLCDAFCTGQDIHTQTAAEIFNVPFDQVTPKMRNVAKAVNFGIVYGISSFGLSRDVGLTTEQAKQYIDGYFARYPGVRAYMEQVVALGRKQGFVQTIFSRRRYLPDLRSRNRVRRNFSERAAINTPIQGSAADIIKAAMVSLANALDSKGLRARLLLQVHDELVLEVPEDEVEPTAKLVRQQMEQIVRLVVPLAVQVKIGQNWLETQTL